MRDLGFDDVVNLSLTDPGARRRGCGSPRTTSRRGRSGSRNPLSVEHSVLRTTLLGSLLDVRRYNLARGAERVALFESGRVYLREGSSRDGRPAGRASSRASGRRPRSSPTGSAALAVGPLAPAELARRGAAGRLLRAQGRARGARRAARGRAGGRAGDAAVPASGPGGRGAARRRRAGWLGEIHPLVCRDMGPRARRRRSRSTWRRWSRPPRSAGSSYEDVITYPAVLQDLAVVVDEDVPRGARPGGGRWPAAASCCAARRSSTSTAASRSGEGRKSLALRLEFRAPDRTLTDEEVAERREAIKAALEAIGGSLRE